MMPRTAQIVASPGKEVCECLAPTRGNDLQGAYAKNSENGRRCSGVTRRWMAIE